MNEHVEISRCPGEAMLGKRERSDDQKLGALLIQGIPPGPQVMTKHPELLPAGVVSVLDLLVFFTLSSNLQRSEM